MTIGFVTSTKYNSGPDGGTTPVADTTGGSLLFCVSQANGGTAYAPTDFYGNSWAARGPNYDEGFAGLTLRMYDCVNPTVGSGHTFSTFAPPGSYPFIYILAFSGTAASPFDQQSGSGDTISSVSIQPGSITPSEDNEVLIAGTANLGFGLSIDSGFTIAESDDYGGNNDGGGAAYLIQTSAGAVNPTWTENGGYVLSNKVAVIAAYKALASGTTTSTCDFDVTEGDDTCAFIVRRRQTSGQLQATGETGQRKTFARLDARERPDEAIFHVKVSVRVALEAGEATDSLMIALGLTTPTFLMASESNDAAVIEAIYEPHMASESSDSAAVEAFCESWDEYDEAIVNLP